MTCCRVGSATTRKRSSSCALRVPCERPVWETRVSANRSMLDGIRVAAMSGQIFGPYCTQMLADLGADVVKVEPPTGDMLRNLCRALNPPGMVKIHMTINRGKRSV